MSSVTTSAAALSGACLQIGERLRLRSDEIGHETYAHIQAVVPDPPRDNDPEYQEGVCLAIAALLDYVFDGLATGGHWGPSIPPPGAEQARRAARAGASLGVITRRYLAAHGRLGECVAEELARCGFASDGQTIHHLQRIREQLLQQLTAAVEREYNDESEKLVRPRAQRDRLVVRRLLRHEPVAAVELDELAYAVARSWHIGVLAAGALAEEAIKAIRLGLRCELLAIDSGEGAIWAWLGSERKICAKRVSDHLDAGLRVCLAVGEPRFGIDGWRRTHGEALAAWPLARGQRHGAIRCANVTLEAALLGSDVLARLHCETYLAPLESLRDRGQTARQTLRALFQNNGSIASTSAALQITRRGVEKRLSVLDEVLPRPLRECQPELEVALRVEEHAASQGASLEGYRRTSKGEPEFAFTNG